MRKIKKVTAALCAIVLLCACALAEVKKEEIVYVKLTSAGAPESVYIVNAFEASQYAEIMDYGKYESVVNLTDTRALTFDEGALTLALDKGRFYYQGEMAEAELPWNFEITYWLDGTQMDAQALAGAEGALEIRLAVSENERSKTKLFSALTLQITFTLDGDKCLAISAPKGTIAAAGKNRTVAFVALPGMGAEYAITADVSDFAMTGATIAAVPMNMDAAMYVQAITGSMPDGVMRDNMQTVIGNMLLAMQGGDAESFASQDNPAPAAVQFVMMTEGIAPAVPVQTKEAPAGADASNQGFFDRFAALFQ